MTSYYGASSDPEAAFLLQVPQLINDVILWCIIRSGSCSSVTGTSIVHHPHYTYSLKSVQHILAYNYRTRLKNQ